MRIRPIHRNDIEKTAEVHKAAFPRQRHSMEWIECNSNAFPKVQYFVAEDKNDEIIGYIHWTQKSGFRPEVVLEIEQLAVHPKKHGNGVGTKLINESLPLIKSQLTERGAKIKHIIVTTRADNYAQELYKKVLGAEIEATISNLYSADEVIMIARSIKISA
jgi:predicted N-acetyltransferase YhbS